MSLKPPQVPKSGSTLLASARVMPNGEWRATTQVKQASGEVQDAQTWVFETEGEARRWIDAVAAAGGFDSVTWL